MSERHTEPHPDLGGYVLGGLGPGEAEAFEAHLATCDLCRAEVEELRPLPGLLDEAAGPVELPPDLRARTLAAVAAAPIDLTDPAGGRRPPPGTPAGELAAPRRGGGRWQPGLRRLAVAAVAVVALAAGLTVVNLGRDQQPALAEFELVAPPGQPGRGRAVVRDSDAGRVVELEVEGLPPSPSGTFYECWFVADGDTLEAPKRVSAGTFRVGSDGRAELRMVSAADLERFPKMGVTIEPDDGDPRRTGDKVLVSR